jgi:hypothetical protein
MVDYNFPWGIVYKKVQQILAEHSSQAPLSDFQSLLGTEWLEDSVITALINCMKRGIPMPDSAAARTMEPPSALRSSAAGKHARCAWQIHAESFPPPAIPAQCRTPPKVQQDEAPLALWNGVDCFSTSPLIPCQSCRTIHQGDELDCHLGTCLCCTRLRMIN